MNATSAVYDNSLQLRGKKALTAPLWVALCCCLETSHCLYCTLKYLPHRNSFKVGIHFYFRYWFSSICKQLSLLVRARRGGLRTTVHILCVAVRLPGNASCWMKAAPVALFFSLGLLSLSISFCLATPHLSSQLASPLLHTNRCTKGWLQTRAVKVIINILHFVARLQGQKFMGTSSIVVIYCFH